MESKIQHLGVAVGSIEEALAFWRDGLGLELKEVEVVEDQGVRVAMLPIGESLSNCWNQRAKTRLSADLSPNAALECTTFALKSKTLLRSWPI